VQVDFRGFKALVDQVGGVEICLSEPQKDFRSGIDLAAGRQTVRGDQALAFVRQRAGLARGDIDRIRRQQLLLGALVRKVLSAGTLLNPVRLNGVLRTSTTSLQVDESLTTGRLRDLAVRLRGLDPASFVFTTAPIADTDARRQGASVVLLDPAESGRLWDRLRRDIPPPPPAPPPPGVAPPPVEERTAAEDPCA
jgi:anionic cell wall polymer biosynthesis LytR-Cps2A-Psr (LCP) family protein